MRRLAQHIERIWWRDAPPPIPLRLLSPLYRAISARQLARRAARTLRPPVPLISVGNLTAGGSGKTPFALWLCGELAAAGYRPVLLCRGDGGTLHAPRRVRVDDDPALHGDEAVMLARAGIAPVVAARDRVAGARLAAEHGDVIVLDDGFQYRSLMRDCDIVLVPAEGCGNGALIPAGPLREPLAALARADLIVRTGEDVADALGAWREWRFRMRPAGLARISGAADAPPKVAVAVCAIARPERFFAMLRGMGIRLEATVALPDHHRFRPADLAALPPCLPAITTAKDEVKLRAVWPEGRELWRLDLRPEPEPGLFDAILARLRNADATRRA
ncbi:MAG: tetraacyldisaccharide 4'-kinase [Mariprofundaceae bacterium]